jgi:hypothetical protein
MAGTQVYTVMFEGNAIKTTVTSSGEAVEDWLDKVLYVHRHHLHKLVVRLEVEWCPHLQLRPQHHRDPLALHRPPLPHLPAHPRQLFPRRAGGVPR